MSRDICIYQDFLTEAHRARITSAARSAGMEAHFFSSAQFQAARDCLQHCEVLYTGSLELLRTAPASLKWYCTSNAGVDNCCREEGLFANPDCLFSNCNSYGVTIAEHVIMVTLMLLRQMPAFQEAGRQHRWAPAVPVRSIYGSRITILGTGDLGSTIARRMRGMAAGRITGLNRSGGIREPGLFDEVHPICDLNRFLPETDILVMTLPATPETAGLLSPERIALLPRQALVINVGRGSAVCQEALANALNQGRLAGAALDVTVPEPLPPESPLWSTRNLILTPHVSGSLTLDYTCDRNVELFCQDLMNYAAGRPLAHLVDRRRGY